MKITIDSVELEAFGCVPRHDGRVTLAFHSTDSFTKMVETFDGIHCLTAERPTGTTTWAGDGEIVAISRNLGSDFVNITLAGLVEVREEG